MDRLKGKTCVVTAAGQGIGRAIAEACAREGARVVAVDLRQDLLAGWAEAAGALPRTVDMTDETAVEALAAEFPDATALINCVGLVGVGTVLDCTPADLELSFRVNVLSTTLAIRAFLPGMRERRDGAIVNIASVASSVIAAPKRFSYGATKAAVIGLTKSVALDFIADGVRCNSISPGTVETPSLYERMAAQGDVDAARAAFIARQPMGRMGQPQEIAAIAVLLASDEARFMTGENIVIDGGMSL